MSTEIAFSFLVGRSTRQFLASPSIADLHRETGAMSSRLEAQEQQLSQVQMRINLGNISVDEMGKLITTREALAALIKVDQLAVEQTNAGSSSAAIAISQRNADLVELMRARSRYALLLQEKVLPRIAELRSEVSRVESMEESTRLRIQRAVAATEAPEDARSNIAAGSLYSHEEVHRVALQRERESAQAVLPEVISRLASARESLAVYETACSNLQLIDSVLHEVTAWVQGTEATGVNREEALLRLNERFERAMQALNDVARWREKAGIKFPETVWDRSGA